MKGAPGYGLEHRSSGCRTGIQEPHSPARDHSRLPPCSRACGALRAASPARGREPHCGAPERRSTALAESEGIHPISGTCTPQACDSAAFGWMTGTAGRSREREHQGERGRRPLEARPPRSGSVRSGPMAASLREEPHTTRARRFVAVHASTEGCSSTCPRYLHPGEQQMTSLPSRGAEPLSGRTRLAHRGRALAARSNRVPRAATHRECSAQGRTNRDARSLERYSRAIG
jgi:hypothetical protein